MMNTLLEDKKRKKIKNDSNKERKNFIKKNVPNENVQKKNVREKELNETLHNQKETVKRNLFKRDEELNEY